MAMLSLTQRLYDKTKVDRRRFRNQLVQWHMEQSQDGSVFGGTIADIYWEKCREHLAGKVAEYFEWIESECGSIKPSARRGEAIYQCTGATVSYGRSIRRLAIERYRIMSKLENGVDLGSWHDLNDNAIDRRGCDLMTSLGLGQDASWPDRLNNFVEDHRWLFVGVIALAGTLIALMNLFNVGV